MVLKSLNALDAMIRSQVSQAIEQGMRNPASEWRDALLVAVTTGNYDDFAENLASMFWSSVQSEYVLATEYRKLFSALMEEYPHLREPLQKALDDQNPFKDLLPTLPVARSATWPFETP